MPTFNEVALLLCSSLFSTGALCSHVNETELQVLDMTPAQRSRVHWLAALRKHISQCQPSLPSTPFWCKTRTPASIVSLAKRGFSNRQMKTTNVKMMENREEENSHLHQHLSNHYKYKRYHIRSRFDRCVRLERDVFTNLPTAPSCVSINSKRRSSTY